MQTLERPNVRQRTTQNRRRLTWAGLGVVALLLVISQVVAQMVRHTPGSSETALDNTGASQRQTPTPAPRATLNPGPTTSQVPLTALTSGPLILLNPGLVRPGASVSVTGSGFDPKAVLDLDLKEQAPASSAQTVSFTQANKSGAFTADFAAPTSPNSGTLIVEAHERKSDKLAQASLTISGGAAPQVKLGLSAGNPGDSIALSAQGFVPGEPIAIYWNSLQSQPIAALRADRSGNVRSASVTVPFGAVGNNTFIFLGAQSQSPVTMPFVMLNLYPVVQLSSYAIQAGNALTFSGNGFGPGERVLIYLNVPSGPPIATVQADSTGALEQTTGFAIPFVLKGKQTLIFLGELSRAPTTASFDVVPYMPSAQPSTYSGLPGTTVSFYAAGFARSEIVHIYEGRTPLAAGRMVGCFRTNNQGEAGAVGAYVIPGDVPAGKLTFALTGAESGGVATTTVQVLPSTIPAQAPAQPPFTCTLDQPTQPAAPNASHTPTWSPASTTLPRNKRRLLLDLGRGQETMERDIVSSSSMW
jgi:hypothetical protein